MAKQENIIESYLTQEIRKIGGGSFKWTGINGNPDRIIILDGVIKFVECKSNSGRLSKRQIAFKKKFLKLGVKIYTLNSKEKVDEFVKNIRSL